SHTSHDDEATIAYQTDEEEIRFSRSVKSRSRGRARGGARTVRILALSAIGRAQDRALLGGIPEVVAGAQRGRRRVTEPRRRARAARFPVRRDVVRDGPEERRRARGGEADHRAGTERQHFADGARERRERSHDERRDGAADRVGERLAATIRRV